MGHPGPEQPTTSFTGDLPPVIPGPITGKHPLSHQQDGLVATMARLGDRHGYWLTWAARLHGDIDPGRLSDALALTISRHPALRTTLAPTGDGLTQHVDADPPAALTQVHHDRPSCVDDVASLNVLDGDDTWRIALAPAGDGWELTLVVHHLTFDHWSWGLFLNELGAAYRHLGTGHPLPPRPPVSYGDYARWQGHHLVGDRYAHHLDHWRRLAAGYPATGTPLTSASVPDGHAGGPAETIHLHLDAALVDRLHHLGRNHDTRTFVVLTALFQATLAAFAGRDDVLIGLVTANRRHPEVRDVIGFFANGRILRTAVAPGASVADLVDDVAYQWREGHRHQELHLEKSVLDLGLPELVNVKFGLRNTLTYLPRPAFGPGTGIEYLPTADPASSRRHLNVWLEPTSTGLAGHATYRTDVLPRPDAERLTAAYLGNLRVAATRPTTAARALSPLRPTGTRRPG